MLKLDFEFSGGPDAATELQARALVSALHTLFGDAILPASLSVTNRVGEIAVTVAGQPQAVKSHLASTTAPAPDGYPAENPAAAFGDTDAPAAAFAEHTHSAGTAPATTAPADDTVERDNDGIPWDKRIHAETKTKTAKGIWTRRRNTPDHLFDDVMKELKAANTARTVAALPTPAAGGAVPLPPSPAPAPTSSAAPAPSPAPAAPAASSTAPGGLPPELTTPATSFPTMMVKITKAQSLGLLTPDTLTGILVAAGAQPDAAGKVSMMAMNKDASIIPTVDALLSEHLGA